MQPLKSRFGTKHHIGAATGATGANPSLFLRVRDCRGFTLWAEWLRREAAFGGGEENEVRQEVVASGRKPGLQDFAKINKQLASLHCSLSRNPRKSRSELHGGESREEWTEKRDILLAGNAACGPCALGTLPPPVPLIRSVTMQCQGVV